jgi:hypothetical protein
MKQNVQISVPSNANDACAQLGLSLPGLAELGLHVISQAVSEGHLTLATTVPGFFGPIVANSIDLPTLARALNQEQPEPDGPPTV